MIPGQRWLRLMAWGLSWRFVSCITWRHQVTDASTLRGETFQHHYSAVHYLPLEFEQHNRHATIAGLKPRPKWHCKHATHPLFRFKAKKVRHPFNQTGKNAYYSTLKWRPEGTTPLSVLTLVRGFAARAGTYRQEDLSKVATITCACQRNHLPPACSWKKFRYIGLGNNRPKTINSGTARFQKILRLKTGVPLKKPTGDALVVMKVFARALTFCLLLRSLNSVPAGGNR